MNPTTDHGISKTNISTIWNQHPARQLNYDTLMSGLENHVRNKLVIKNQKGSLAIYCYSTRAATKASWDIFTLIARGLIIDTEQCTVVATPFPKFFNYGEAQIWDADKSEGEILVTTKYDGSLGIVFYHSNNWQVSTKGSFESEQAVWATRCLHLLNSVESQLYA